MDRKTYGDRFRRIVGLRTADGVLVNKGGAGSGCDVSVSQYPSPLVPGAVGGSLSPVYGGNSSFGFTGILPFVQWYTLYRTFWEAGKIVDIVPGDMTREGWDWKSDTTPAEALKGLSQTEKELGVSREITAALRYQRLYGGGVVLLGVSEDGNEDASQPLHLDEIGPGDLRFVRAIDRTRINSTGVDSNPLSPSFMRPKTYTIAGHTVHRSRLLIFSGKFIDGPLNRLNYWNSQDGFGFSVLESLYEDITRAAGVRQAAYQLANVASVPVIKPQQAMDLAGTTAGTAAKQKLSTILDLMSVYRGVVLDKADEFDTWAANFGSLPDLVLTYLQVLSAASDIPAPRFIGEAPGGLNASGKGDLINYYDSIGSKQTEELEQPLLKLGHVLARSTIGADIPDLSVEFRPLLQPDRVEDAGVRSSDAALIASLVDIGVITDEEARRELLEREVLSNLDPEAILPTLGDPGGEPGQGLEGSADVD